MSGPALLVAVFTAAPVTLAVIVCGAAMIAVHPLLAVAVNLIVAAGVAPWLWGWRAVPVWRWAVYGTAVGVALGWLALLVGVR